MAFEVNRRQSVRKADGDAGEEAASARKGAGEVRESAGKLIVWQEAIGNAGEERQEVIGNAGAGRRWREGGGGRRGWRAKRREMSGGVRAAVPDTAEVRLKGLEASGEA